MEYEVQEQLVSKYLAARNLIGLFKPLLDIKGFKLGDRYTLRWLYAVGGQSIIYLAESEANKIVIVKMALLPYHRPAYIGTDEIRQARQNLEREASLLKSFQGAALPDFYDLLHTHNPLHSPARGIEITDKEPYLVMEFIQGRTLLDLSRSIFRSHSPDFNKVESLAWSVLDAVVELSILISERENAFLYSDINPVNLMLSAPPDKRIRILDAGSLTPLHKTPDIKPHFTSSFVPKDYYDAHVKGQTLWPTKNYVTYTLGKTLWSVLTNRHPYPAEEPDLTDSTLKNYSQSLRTIIHDLIEGRFESFFQLKMAIEPWTANNITPEFDAETFLPKVEPKNENRPDLEKTYSLRNSRSSNLAPSVEKHWAGFEPIRMLRFSPDGQHIAIISENKVEFLDAHTLRERYRFTSSHSQPFTSLDFDTTGEYFATGSHNGFLSLWERESQDPIWETRADNINGLVALSGSANILAAVNKWNAITFIPERGRKIKERYNGLTDLCTCIAMAKSRLLLGVGGFGGIQLWDLETGADLMKIRMRKIVRHMVISSEEEILLALISEITPSPHLSVGIWSIGDNQNKRLIEFKGKNVSEIRLDSENHLVLIGSMDGSVRIWNQKAITPYIFLEDYGPISSIDLSPDGQMLAIGALNGEVSLYPFGELIKERKFDGPEI